MRVRITEARRALRLPRVALAEALGISDRQMSRYESGAAPITLDRLAEIAAELDVPTRELLTFDPPTSDDVSPAGANRWRVETTAVGAIMPVGSLIAELARSPVAGDVVLVEAATEDQPTRLLLRQFLPPGLLVTNSGCGEQASHYVGDLMQIRAVATIA